MRDKQGVDPELVVREGEPIDEILSQVNEDREIGVIVLGAGTGRKGPGPLVTALSKTAGTLPIPMTIVPGELSKEQLEAIT
jgi:nucleotide-binding universal stress UspA family protein